MSSFSSAWKAFWSILTSPELAEKWTAFSTSETVLPPAPSKDADRPEPSQPDSDATHQDIPGESIHTLAILQREARLIDFLQEDLSPYTDAQVGIAVRKIHDDAHAALEKYFKIRPIRTEEEGAKIDVPSPADPKRIQLSGAIRSNEPQKGVLLHRGWLASNINLPKRTVAVDPAVIIPAQIELK